MVVMKAAVIRGWMKQSPRGPWGRLRGGLRLGVPPEPAVQTLVRLRRRRLDGAHGVRPRGRALLAGKSAPLQGAARATSQHGGRLSLGTKREGPGPSVGDVGHADPPRGRTSRGRDAVTQFTVLAVCRECAVYSMASSLSRLTECGPPSPRVPPTSGRSR